MQKKENIISFEFAGGVSNFAPYTKYYNMHYPGTFVLKWRYSVRTRLSANLVRICVFRMTPW